MLTLLAIARAAYKLGEHTKPFWENVPKMPTTRNTIKYVPLAILWFTRLDKINKNTSNKRNEIEIVKKI